MGRSGAEMTHSRLRPSVCPAHRTPSARAPPCSDLAHRTAIAARCIRRRSSCARLGTIARRRTALFAVQHSSTHPHVRTAPARVTLPPQSARSCPVVLHKPPPVPHKIYMALNSLDGWE